MKNSVCASTYIRYQRAWVQWLAYLKHINLSIFYRYLQRLNFHDQRVVLIGFMRYRRVEVMDSSSSVNGFLSAIRFEFVCNFYDDNIFSDSIIKQAKKSLSKLVTKKDKERIRLVRYPIPIALLLGSRTLALTTIIGRAKFTATLLAFHLFMRVGEYAMNGKRSKHVLMCDAVLYECSGHGLISAPIMCGLTGNFVITGVMVIFRGDKTHPEWKESYHYINNLHDEGASEEERKLVLLMVEWARLSKVKEEDPFFTRYETLTNRKQTRYCLRTSDISDFLNEIAVANGYDSGTFKPHSLRAGAAAEMHKSDVLPETINHAGRWAFESGMGVSYANKDDRVIGALSGIGDGAGSFTEGHIKSAKIPRRPKQV